MLATRIKYFAFAVTYLGIFLTLVYLIELGPIQNHIKNTFKPMGNLSYFIYFQSL